MKPGKRSCLCFRTVDRHPGVLPLVVLGQLLLGDLEDLAAGAGEVLPGLCQANPVHQRKTRSQSHLVPRIACGEMNSVNHKKMGEGSTIRIGKVI